MAEAVRSREASDVHPLGVAIGAGVVVLGVAIAVLAPWLELAHVAAPARAPNNAPVPRVAGPRLQTAPHLDLEAFLREKRGRLESYGLDAASGRAHVPIERAMQMLLAREGAGARRP